VPKFRSDLNNSGVYDDGGIRPGNNPLWIFSTGPYINPGPFVESSPAVVDGVVYIGNSYGSYYGTEGNVFAINANTGDEIWRFAAGGDVTSGPAVVDGVVYIGSQNGYVFALDANTGTQVWNFPTGCHGSISPAVANGVVYFGSGGNSCSGKFYALDARTGTEIWSILDTTSQGFVGSPAVVNGVVYFGDAFGYVYALDANTGTQVWKVLPMGTANTLNAISSPAVVDGIVYFGSMDGKVYAINANTGATIWSYTTGSYVSSSPAVANGVVYIGSMDGKLYALDATTGTQTWNFVAADGYSGGVVGSPAVANGVVYVGGWGSGTMYALDATTGAQIWSYKGYPGRSSPAIANGVVYFGGSHIGSDGDWASGNVYALENSHVSFTGTPTSGVPPLTVQFTGVSTRLGITGWNWSFGDGSLVNANVQNPLHTYASPGTYTVSLSVTNASGSKTVTIANYITATAANTTLVADFTATPTSGTAPLTVQFTDTTTGSNLTAWNWSFGDSTWFNTSNSSLRNASHIYTTSGTYTVNLTVFANASVSNTTSRMNYITVSSGIIAPVPGFTGIPQNGTAPLEVRFNDTSTGVGMSSYQWIFSDNLSTVYTTRNVTHTFASSGVYDVYHSVTNIAGTVWKNETGYITATAPVGAPVPGFTGTPQNGTAPLEVRFNDASSGTGITSYQWVFSDNLSTIYTTRNVTHTFASSGVYDVDHSVTNSAGTVWKNETGYITVTTSENAPVIHYHTPHSSSQYPMVGGLINFNLVSYNKNTYQNLEWDFGDGSVSNETDPSHIFNKPIKYEVKVYGINNNGRSYLAGINLDLTLIPGDILLDRSAKAIAIPGEWTNTALYYKDKNGNDKIIEAGADPVSIDGDLSDWYYSDVPGTPNKTYVRALRVKTTDDIREKAIEFALSKEGEQFQWLLYGSSIDPKKDVNGNKWYGSELVWAAYKTASNGTIDFDSKDMPIRFDLGGITPSEIADSPQVELIGEHLEERPDIGPSHLPNMIIGQCPIRLELTDSSGRILNEMVNQIPNSSYILEDIDGDGELDNIILIANGQIEEYLLRVIPLPNAQITDTYSIYVYNTTLDQSVNTSPAIIAEHEEIGSIPPEEYTISLPPVAIISTSLIPFPSFNTIPTDPDGDGLYEDLDGDGNVTFMDVIIFFQNLEWISTNEPLSMFDYDKDSRISFFDVIALFNKMNEMNPLPPAADFSATPGIGFAPLNVQFTDKSSLYISSWQWEFGPGGSTSGFKNPYFTYNETGNWTVNLTVKNKAGESTLSKTDYIIVAKKPVSAFTSSTTSGIGSMLMHFVDQSTDATGWSWDFGDGMNSTLQNPDHWYNKSGNFSVTLTASNIGGKGDPFETNFTRGNDTIPVLSPGAEFSMNSSVGISPFTIQFNDHSTGTPSLAYQWNFGDDSSNSTGKDPVHTFTATANTTYTITLTASNSAGSSSKSAVIAVNVTPPVIPPVANFNANITSGLSPLSVQFNDTSTGSQLLTYQWDFGDGSANITDANPEHVFTTSSNQTFIVTLAVSNSVGSSSQSSSIAVNITPPYTGPIGQVYFSTIPQGATIVIDGTPSGAVTPTILTLPVGKHVAILKHAGYNEVEANFEVKKNAMSSVARRLSPGSSVIPIKPVTTVVTTTIPTTHVTTAIPTTQVTTVVPTPPPDIDPTGQVYFSTTPQGAVIVIDGAPSGSVTPIILTLPVGTHVAILKFGGYNEVEAIFEVKKNAMSSVARRLSPGSSVI
jgi:PKD repeat protein